MIPKEKPGQTQQKLCIYIYKHKIISLSLSATSQNTWWISQESVHFHPLYPFEKNSGATWAPSPHTFPQTADDFDACRHLGRVFTWHKDDCLSGVVDLMFLMSLESFGVEVNWIGFAMTGFFNSSPCSMVRTWSNRGNGRLKSTKFLYPK